MLTLGALVSGRPLLAGPPALRVTLLGTGNPRPSIERFGPASLVEGVEGIEGEPKSLLVDAGRGTTTRLFQLGEGRLLSSVDCVVLTHLHSDHVVGLPDLWLTGWIFGRERPLRVYGPRGTRAMMENLERAFEFDVRMRRDVDERLPAAGVTVVATDLTPGAPFECNGFRITGFSVNHGPVAPAFGYRVEAAGRKVVFSGDTRESDSLIANARGADLLVHEVVSPEAERRYGQVKDVARTDRIIGHHTTPEAAGRVFSAVAPRLAVYSHIVPSPATGEDLIGPTRRTYKGPLEVGEDLMVITVGERIVVTRSPPVRSSAPPPRPSRQ